MARVVPRKAARLLLTMGSLATFQRSKAMKTAPNAHPIAPEKYGCILEERNTGGFRLKHVRTGHATPWTSEVCAMVVDDPMHAVFGVAVGDGIIIMNPAEYAEHHNACGYSSHQV